MMGKFSLLVLTVLLFIMPQSNFAAVKLGQVGGTAAENNDVKVNILFDNKVEYELLRTYGVNVIHEYESIQAVMAEMNADIISSFAAEQGIKSVQLDQPVQTQAQMKNWGHDSLNIGNKIPSSLTGKGVNIAIIDSGVDVMHPDLVVAGGECFLELASYPDACTNGYDDDNGHGTHVAGTIAALDNDFGVVGIAPGSNIYALKALDKTGFGTTSSVVAAVDWAIQNKMDIVNLSLATSTDDPVLKAIIQKAYSLNIMIVAAAGNDEHVTGEEENVGYPAKYEEVIAVSALNKDHTLASTSSVGMEVEFAAPGIAIISTLPTRMEKYKDKYGYTSMSGTSMAAPFVAAMAAIYMEKYPDLSKADIRRLLQQNALDLGATGKDAKYGYGLIQPDMSVIDPPKTVLKQTTITTSVEDSATIRIGMDQLPIGATSYNLYRFNTKIIANGTSLSIEDYGMKGRVEYLFVPLMNGEEMNEEAISFLIDIVNPELTDMNNQYWFSRNMLYLYKEGIMNGYMTGELRPHQQITRGEAIILLVNALGLPLNNSTTFVDVATASAAAGHIGAAAQHGIVNGFTDGTFRPNQAVTRAEMSILIANAYQLSDVDVAGVSFKDLPAKLSGYDHMRRIVANGIAQGYADQTFRPHEYMSRSTFAVFLSRAENELFRIKE